MTRQEMWKEFIQAVDRKDRAVTAAEIASELYGGEPAVQLEIAYRIASECKQAGLLLVSTDYQEIDLTPQGRTFIGKK